MTHTARVWRTLPRYRQCFVVPGLEGTSVGSDSRCLAPPDYYRLANFNANLDALAPAGIIQLQHDLLQSSVDAVSSFISSARAKGYSFVSIDRCIHGPNFQRNPSWVRCAPSPKGGGVCAPVVEAKLHKCGSQRRCHIVTLLDLLHFCISFI